MAGDPPGRRESRPPSVGEPRDDLEASGRVGDRDVDSARLDFRQVVASVDYIVGAARPPARVPVYGEEVVLTRGATCMVMTARTTSVPFLSTTLTGTPTLCSSLHSLLSRRAVAVTSVSALRRYSMVMPRVVQRIAGGMVTSVTVPAASSHKVAMANE